MKVVRPMCCEWGVVVCLSVRRVCLAFVFVPVRCPHVLDCERMSLACSLVISMFARLRASVSKFRRVKHLAPPQVNAIAHMDAIVEVGFLDIWQNVVFGLYVPKAAHLGATDLERCLFCCFQEMVIALGLRLFVLQHLATYILISNSVLDGVSQLIFVCAQEVLAVRA